MLSTNARNALDLLRARACHYAYVFDPEDARVSSSALRKASDLFRAIAWVEKDAEDHAGNWHIYVPKYLRKVLVAAARAEVYECLFWRRSEDAQCLVDAMYEVNIGLSRVR